MFRVRPQSRTRRSSGGECHRLGTGFDGEFITGLQVVRDRSKVLCNFTCVYVPFEFEQYLFGHPPIYDGEAIDYAYLYNL